MCQHSIPYLRAYRPVRLDKGDRVLTSELVSELGEITLLHREVLSTHVLILADDLECGIDDILIVERL